MSEDLLDAGRPRAKSFRAAAAASDATTGVVGTTGVGGSARWECLFEGGIASGLSVYCETSNRPKFTVTLMTLGTTGERR